MVFRFVFVFVFQSRQRDEEVVMLRRTFLTLFAMSVVCTTTWAAGIEKGTIHLTSGGPLAFGPNGVLFISDPMAATIYAVNTDDKEGSGGDISVDDIRGKFAAMLGTESDDIRIDDLAVNPLSGNAYLAVTRGSGSAVSVVIFRVSPGGEIAEMSLDNVEHDKATLPNAPESREGRQGNQRMETVTDLAFMDGHLYIAGLSNEEFASKLRSIAYPFDHADDGTSVEIFHGAHGQYETRSPVRTFAAYDIEGQSHLLAAYTCTPLVKIPVADLQAGKKVRGTTVAELGNRNRPLDMFVYEKDGQDYILMANSSRGVMKISTADVAEIDEITEPVPGGGTAGLPYETIKELAGVLQLDRLDDDNALALVRSEDGKEHLQTIALP